MSTDEQVPEIHSAPVVALAAGKKRKAQDSFQLPEVNKRKVSELAVELGFTRVVKGEITGNRAPVYNDLIEYALAHREDFLKWRTERLKVPSVVEVPDKVG